MILNMAFGNATQFTLHCQLWKTCTLKMQQSVRTLIRTMSLYYYINLFFPVLKIISFHGMVREWEWFMIWFVLLLTLGFCTFLPYVSPAGVLHRLNDILNSTCLDISPSLGFSVHQKIIKWTAYCEIYP